MMALPPLARVSFDNLLKFLIEQEISLWDLVNENSGDATEDMIRVTLTEMFNRMGFQTDAEEVYVFPYDDPYGVACNTDFSKPIPELANYKELEEYQIFSSGADFLWFAFSPEEASNGFHWTLLMRDEDEE